MRPAHLPVLIVLAGALCACSDQPEAGKAPTTIAAAAGAGAEIHDNYGDLLIEAKLPTQPQETEYVSQIGAVSKRVAEAVQAGASDLPPDVKTVSILALRPDLDRLGNDAAHSFAMVTYKVTDLKQAHIDRLGAFGVLDLAQEVHPVLPWQLAIGTWCVEHDRAPNFCMQAHSALGPGVPWNGPPGT